MLTAAAADAFVGGLALPEPHEYASLTETVSNAASAFPGAMAALQPTTGQSAAVNAGSLTSFVEGVDVQKKTDVMNSTLLAQLAANKAHDRYKQPLDWFKFYSNVLQNIGWNMPGAVFDKYTSGGSTVNIDKAVLEILGAICTGNEIAVVASTLNALKNLPAGSPQITIWNANASDGTAGNFQILPCAQTPNGNIVMVMDAMQFTARVSRGQFLWWSWSSTEIDISRAAQRLELNMDVYGRVRATVSQKLGDRAASFVGGLDI